MNARALWCSAIVVSGIAAYIVLGRYEPAIASANAVTELLYAKTAANERTVQQSPVLHALENAAQRDLRAISADRSLAAATASLMIALQRSATRFGVRLDSIEPQAAQSDSSPAADTGLLPTPIVLRVRGHFRNIVWFVNDLSRHATPVNVSGTNIALTHAAPGADPLLDATVQATLYRLRAAVSSHD